MGFLTLLMVVGGVALIVFGVRFLRRGLDRLFGPSLGHWIQRLTDRRLRAFFSGISIALIAPSSTTLSVLCVQTIQAGHAKARQMLALMFGADIGMTILVLLLAFRIEKHAPVLILIGLPFYHFKGETRRRGFGQVILSLGFIYLGVDTIRRTILEHAPDEALTRLIEAAAAYPFILFLISAVIAVCLQSGTATIAMMIGLAASGIRIGSGEMIAVVAGANVGVAITTLLIGFTLIESRRLALGNLMVKAAVAIACLGTIGWLARWFGGTDLRLVAQIAAMHTGFNVVVALVGVPLVGPIVWLTQRISPRTPDAKTAPFGPRYIHNGTIDSVALAIGQSMREILRVAEIVREMFEDLWRALGTNDLELNLAVSNRDDEVDLLDTQIKHFLTRLSAEGLDRNNAAEQMRQLRYLNELESIGDILDKNLSELVSKKIRKGTTFSKQGWQELEDFYTKVAENMLIAETAFNTRDRLLARKLLRHKDRIDATERELRDRHFERLNAGQPETHESSAVHLDILTHLKRINSCVTHIGYAIIQDTEGQSAA